VSVNTLSFTVNIVIQVDAVTPILLAVGSALVWGASDFCGGKGARRAGAPAVTVVSQVIGLPVLAAGLVLVPGSPRTADLAWGAAAGLAGLVGIVLLYRGLAGGAMAVVSPVTAVTAAVVPLAAGLVLDGALPWSGFAGSLCAVLAIVLVGMAPSGGARGVAPPGLVLQALAAGAGFGAFFILLGQAHPDTGLWTLVGVRMTSIPLGLLLALRAGASLRLPRRALAWAAVAGAGDLAANGLFLLAAMRGHLGIVAVLASLYPASTVLLALTVDRERLRGLQVAGLGLAATALVLTAS
jgi:drug/metabolite transporter (DMT)-like permease